MRSLTVELRRSGESFIHIKNSNGPKTVPWGTPDVVTPVADEAPADWYAVLETIQTELRNTQVSSKDDDEEVFQTLLKIKDCGVSYFVRLNGTCYVMNGTYELYFC